MPTLRDHVKDTLSRTEPDERQARADLQAVMRKAKKPSRAWLVVPVFAAAAIAVWIVALQKKPPPQEARRDGIHLYLRASGEPEGNAITLDLEQD